MSPQELDSLAIAFNEAIADACAALRAEQAQALSEIRRNAEQVARALEHQQQRADRLQRDLDASREAANEPAIRTALMDIDGALHIVQRSGPPLTVRIADLQALVDAKVAERMAEVESRFTAELNSHVARAMQRLGNAAPWLRTAFYGPGAVVTCYVGRVYALRDGIAASMAQEPGEHPEVWERIGSQGLRVMKSKPAQLEAGDVFTDGESRFIHDGQTTTLLVQRMLKQSDLDRMFKPLQAELRAKRNGGTE